MCRNPPPRQTGVWLDASAGGQQGAPALTSLASRNGDTDILPKRISAMESHRINPNLRIIGNGLTHATRLLKQQIFQEAADFLLAGRPPLGRHGRACKIADFQFFGA